MDVQKGCVKHLSAVAALSNTSAHRQCEWFLGTFQSKGKKSIEKGKWAQKTGVWLGSTNSFCRSSLLYVHSFFCCINVTLNQKFIFQRDEK